MRRAWSIMGLGAAAALLVAALWGWENAARASGLWPAPATGATAVPQGTGPWAVRCAALAAGALGQVLALSVLMHGIYRRDVVSEVLRLSGLLLFMAAGVIAVALGLAGH